MRNLKSLHHGSNGTTQIVKRDGRTEPFNDRKIANAVKRCFVNGVGETEEISAKIAEAITAATANIVKRREGTLTVDEIQEIVIQQLWASDFSSAATQYTLYRENHRQDRIRKPIDPADQALIDEDAKHFPTPLQYYQFISKYARWNPIMGRRETWRECVDRVMAYFKSRPQLKPITEQEWKELDDGLYSLAATPAMRVIQMAGPALLRCEVGAFNCSYTVIDCLEAFSEVLYILMQGAGVGFSVESCYVDKLPRVKKQRGKNKQLFTVQDSTEGWCDALRAGVESWFAGDDVTFDYSNIRPEGARLKTKGGRSSGPGVLKQLLTFVRDKILAKQNSRLSDIDCHDICCMIGKIVQVGGVRRASLISLSDLDSRDMRDAKSYGWWENAKWRDMSNNSAVYEEKPSALDFMEEWMALAKSGSGERGIFNREGAMKNIPKRRKAVKFGLNPCLTGDTLVYVADGRHAVSFEQLAKEGKDVPVFCSTGDNQLAIRMMRQPRITSHSEDVYRVTFDDGSSVRATANHKFQVRGKKGNSTDMVELKDLKVGDSLRIITRYTPESVNTRSQSRWDRYISVSVNGVAIPEHTLIAEFGAGRKVGPDEHVHHEDGNRLNNTNDNLKIVNAAEHLVEHSAGEANKRFCGMSHDDLIEHGRKLCKSLGYRFSSQEWMEYANRHSLPKNFSKWRRATLGGIIDFAKRCAILEGITDSDQDPRHVRRRRQFQEVANQQLDVFTSIKQFLGHVPTMPEWRKACKERGIKATISGRDDPFKSWKDLVDSASTFNHRVEKITYEGKEVVYNGTVDEFHNYFVGGWDSGLTARGRRKHTWIDVSNCGEVLLRSSEFCNLSIVTARKSDDLETLKKKIRLATIFGTLQSTLTNFKYIRPTWKQNCDEERLLGVDINGQMDCPLLRPGAPDREKLLDELLQTVLETNREFADRLGIPHSAATTCVKPDGNSSQLFDCSSGFHPRHSQFYIRRVRGSSIDPVSTLLKDCGVPCHPEPNNPSLVVFEFPVKSPDGAVTRNDLTAIEMLENWLVWKKHWAEHSVSATIYVEPHEWLAVGNWVYEHFDDISGLSFLPKDGGTYALMPYEEITEDEYNKLLSTFPEIPWAKLSRYEPEDMTTSSQELACTGGVCMV